MFKLFMILVGGGLGSLMRFFVDQVVVFFIPSSFALGVALVNITGCLAYGMCGAMLKAHHPNWLSAFVLIGFLGGYTTFSTYMADNVGLMELNRLSWMFFNMFLQTALGFGAFVLGRWLVN